MVFIFTCLCYNLKIHLGVKPVESTDGSLLPIECSKWKPLLNGQMGLAGLQMEQPHLATPMKFSKETKEGWRGWRCLNCNQDLFIHSPLKPLNVYLNGSIPQKTKEERIADFKKATTKDWAFSQAYRLILQEDEEALNTLIMGPEESDTEAFEAFSTLQKKLEQLLKDEHKKMKERIEAFTAEQDVAYKDLQSKAYRDRKIVWHKLCSQMKWDFSAKDITPSPVSGLRTRSTTDPVVAMQPSYNKNVVIFEDYEVERPLESTMLTSPDALTEPQPTARADLPEDLEKELDKSTMFDFDEDNRRIPDEEPKKPIDGDTSESPESETESSEEPEQVAKVSEPSDLTGTSMPIGVPSRLLMKQRMMSYAPPARLLAKDKEVILSKQFGEPSTEEELSKSFDVPFSGNRKVSLARTYVL
eukprot:TRINITY_DN8751_c0_g1_i1.p1 TRINITY_DN8751_c0_g1~~TRINITY_DN8751_c0_g1_i1.p1  ORF type:complete len:415 (+),score=87.95 TRINITY_DN8751_c0_g1_i1:84-1328(+)